MRERQHKIWTLNKEELPFLFPSSLTKLHLLAKEKLTSFIYIISDLLLIALGNEKSSIVHSDKGTTEVISMSNTSKNCTALPPYPHKVSSASGLVVNSIPIISEDRPFLFETRCR